MSASMLIEGCRRGIYILEFANGQRYVGQSVNVVTRFSTHTHGSRHHTPWTDIEAISFRPIPQGDLDAAERDEIARQLRLGFELRNKTFNVGHVEEAALDPEFPVADQEHWATGAATYNRSGMLRAAVERNGLSPSKLASINDVSIARAVTTDLACALTNIVPNAVELERKFWTLSDMPATVGGRYACISCGVLELLFFPRRMNQFAMLNLSPMDLPGLDEDHELVLELPGKREAYLITIDYPLLSVNSLIYPIGELAGALEKYPELTHQARRLAVDMMRYRKSGLFARFHSETLVGEIYRHAVAHGPPECDVD